MPGVCRCPTTRCVRPVLETVKPVGTLRGEAGVVLDDYDDYGGCRTATDAFLATHEDMELRSSVGSAVLYRCTKT